jgi:diguanylate cyclase (GGDEF)-like protein
MAEADPRSDQLLHNLDEATRLLASEMDEPRLVERALHAFAEFGQTERVALLLIDKTGSEVELAGGLADGKRVHTVRRIPILNSPLEEVIKSRRAAVYPLRGDDEIPLPTFTQPWLTRECLCLPLIGNRHMLIGVMTMACRPDAAPSGYQMQMLNVLATLLAVSLENARLFYLATVDGLTGLYARRYFEMRLDEEVARLARHRGVLSLLMTDIDEFKNVNDRYGHLQGDRVLAELALLLRKTVRKGVDLPCRYGGEEFATILPLTDSDGAREMAERVRRSCEEYRFSSGNGSLTITVSGGVTTMDSDHLVGSEELVRQADAALYEAKAQGRNRICVWSGDSK